ncbi:TonB-dependent receptor [Methylomonas sp. UP202]|uniref:TonB-dependent siderophore receptor n=1 Tax=Methylomonas sp. UP202 TaxID=3040943 RepID=UPI002478B0AB|nr:TonB-dependent receptor [Methylomonas sp. UP202]WGS85385.1 TonB-dependent receptor [Methylomonas sp. UP202]
MSMTSHTSRSGLQPSRLHQAIQHILLASALTVSAAAHAETSTDTASIRHNYHISGGSLGQALRQFATNSGLLYSAEAELTEGKTTAGLDGEYTAEDALKKLLVGTGLTYTFTTEGAVAVRVAETGSNAASTLPAVRVVGKATSDSTENYSVWSSSTATKTDTPLMDTPISVQVVPQQVLDDQQAIVIEDATKNVSGVQRVWNGEANGQDFVIRGFGTRYTRFRNGQRISNFNTDMANVEQVEVLKGSAAMLYGRVEPGGMVNVVTKKPQDEVHYSLQQQFGSYDFYRTVAEATGPVTDDKSLSYRMDFGYTDRNSFRDFVSQNQIFVAPALHWQASDKTEFNLSLEYMDRKLPYDTGIPAIGNRVANVPINTNYGQPGSKFNEDPSDSTLLDFNWSHSFNDNWKIQNGFVGNWANLHYRKVLVAVFQPLLEQGSDPMQVRRGSQFTDDSQETYLTYFNLNGKFKTGELNHNVLLGGDYFSDETRSGGFFGFSAANAPFDSPYKMPGDFGGGGFSFSRVNLYNPTYPNLDFNAYENQRINHPNNFFVSQTSWYGLYLQDQISLFDDKLQILGGGRYDWAHLASGSSNSYTNSEDINGNYNGYVPSFNNIVLAKQNEGFFSPRVGILYRPWTWLSVYGNRTEGFGTNNGRSGNGQPLNPETTEQYEAGFKTEWFDGNLTTNTAYFHIDKKNVLTLVSDGGIYDTIGAARSQGIEIDIAGRLSDGLSLITSYAFTDARITADGGAPGNNIGNRLPNVAEHSGSAWLKYAFQQSSLKGLSVGIGSYIAGTREGDNANSYKLPGYVRVDTFAGYTMNVGPTKLITQLNVNNIFDKRYYFTGAPYYANRAWNLPGEPLTIMGSVKLEY